MKFEMRSFDLDSIKHHHHHRPTSTQISISLYWFISGSTESMEVYSTRSDLFPTVEKM